MKKIFLSFDVGYTHLAFNLIELEMDDLLIEPLPIKVLQTETVDIAEIRHKHVSKKACTLHHSNQVSDRMDHFFQEYEKEWAKFGEIAEVFIEIQPPTGVVSVEALIFKQYRSKIKQISPNAMHKWFKISHLEYDARKEATVNHAFPYLNHFMSFQILARQHDQADALLLFLYEMSKRRKIKVREMDLDERKDRVNETFKRLHSETIDEFFEHFRCPQTHDKKIKI